MKYYLPLTYESERQCIKRAQAGDIHAFGCLIEKYKGMLKGFCIDTLGCNFDTAEDIMHEAFRRAWQSIGTFGGLADFSAWLCTIARNQHTAAGREPGITAGPLGDRRPPAKNSLAENRVQKSGMQKRLAQLSQQYQDVIELVHLRAMSYEDTAQILSLPLGKLKELLHAALKEAGPLVRQRA